MLVTNTVTVALSLFLLILTTPLTTADDAPAILYDDEYVTAEELEQQLSNPVLFTCNRFNDPEKDLGYCCAGLNEDGPLTCIDSGFGRRSNGGNLTLRLKHITTIENKDSFGAAAHLSDPYVTASISKPSLKAITASSTIRNSLNPDWKGEEINLGFQFSGTDAHLTVHDEDSGLEMADDLLAAVNFRVPYCNFLNTPFTSDDIQLCTPPPRQPKLNDVCSSTKSSWAMPTGTTCNETGWIALDGLDIQNDACQLPGRSCLRVEFELVPFEVNLEPNSDAYDYAWLTFSMAVDTHQNPLWDAYKPMFAYVQKFGRIHSDDSNAFFYYDYQNTKSGEDLLGAIILQTPKSAKEWPEDRVLADISINFNAVFYVCRDRRDIDGVGDLSWLTSDYGWETPSDFTTIKEELGLYVSDVKCKEKIFPATVKNKWGGVTENLISLMGNKPSHAADDVFINRMYTVYILPYDGIWPPPEPEVDLASFYTFTQGEFVTTLLTFGVFFVYFYYVTSNHLTKNLNNRLDRIETFLATRVMSGNGKNILATLFQSYMLTENNVEFRRNLFYAALCVKVSMTTPLVILWAWGLSTAGSCNPPAVGFAILFIGTSVIASNYGLKLWRQNSWRMSATTMTVLAVSFLCVITYAISVAFIDPAVYEGGQDINFAAVSIVFATLNVLPLVAMSFLNDAKLRVSSKQLEQLLQAAGKGIGRTNNWHGYGSAFNVLLGDAYSVVGTPPAIESKGKSKVAPLAPSIAANPAANAAANADKTPKMFSFGADATASKFLVSPSQRKKLNKTLYISSISVLVIYSVVCVFFTNSGPLALLNSLSLILVDGIHISLSSGTTDWTPGFQALLMSSARIFIMTAGEDYWLAGYSLTFFIYGTALSREIVKKHLPTLSERLASGVVYYGYSAVEAASGDIGGSPDFCLMVMSFFFVLLMSVCAFVQPASLPMPLVDVGGICHQQPWPSYVFAALSFLLVLTTCLAFATVDATYLASRGLLTTNSHLFTKSFKLPAIFAALTELLVVVTGLFVYASTKCGSVFVLSVFLPVIAALGGFVKKKWKENDYAVVNWPPLPVDFDVSTDVDEDQLVAQQLGDLFGGGGDDEDNEGDHFKLPPLLKTGNEIRGEIKMPPLPLKSALKHKQQQELHARKADMKANPQAQEDTSAKKLDDNSLMSFGDDQDDEDDTVLTEVNRDEGDDDVKLLPIRAKFKHQRLQVTHVLYEMAMRHTVLKPFAKLGALLMRFLRCLLPCLRPKKKQTQIKKQDSEGVTINEGGDLNKLLESGGTKDDDEGAERFEEVVYSSMTLYQAARQGYLIWDEYVMLFSTGGLFGMILLMGCIISQQEGLVWTGQFIWVTMYVLIFTYTYFQRLFYSGFVDEAGDANDGDKEEDALLSSSSGKSRGKSVDMSVLAAAITLLTFSLLTFVIHLKADANDEDSLWALNALVLYPNILMIYKKIASWQDNGWVINNIDEDGDGKMSLKEAVSFFGTGPVLLLLLFIFVFELYIFSNIYLATSLLLLILAGVVGLIFLRDWARNDFWLSAKYQEFGDKLINGLQVLALVAVFLLPPESTMFCLSLFFIFYMCECAAQICAYLLAREPEDPIYFSPYVFPVFSYSAVVDDIIDNSNSIFWIYKLLFCGCMWGVTVAMFVAPISYGIFITCVFLLLIVVLTANFLGHVPNQLGQSAKYVSKTDVLKSAVNSRDRFLTRQKPIDSYVEGWEGKTFISNKWDTEKEDDEEFANLATCHILGNLVEKQLHDIRYAPVKDGKKKKVALDGIEDDFDGSAGNASRKKVDEVPRADGIFTWKEALAESLIVGVGPLGFLGCGGLWYKVFLALNGTKLCYHSKIVQAFDEKGARKVVAKTEGAVDSRDMLKSLPKYDGGLDRRYSEELRCCISFVMSLVNSCDTRLKHQKVNFQKFVRENRFKLLSNAIAPPKEVYSGKSGFDVALVATWLCGLTPEERERFHLLRVAFNKELISREKALDYENEQRMKRARELRESLAPKEEENCKKRFEKFKVERQNRMEKWKGNLSDGERERFRHLQISWMSNPTVDVADNDAALRQKFEQHVLTKTDEGTMAAREFLKAVEAGDKFCRPGKFGRIFQFHDPDFLPNHITLGRDLECKERVASEWKQSTQINHEATIFSGGTDPDDVRVGLIKDAWLLSAISMLAAAGGVGDDDLDDQIANLFVSKIGADGQPKYTSEVGAYAVRLFKNNQWEVVVVDDFFPVMNDDDEEKTDANKGTVTGHSEGMQEIWVPLIEKAYAKYYGTYDVLEKGYVWHALKDLTGCETECISLSSAAKGSGKKALWNNLARWRRNGYILGAGTHEVGAKMAFDTGIVPNACYTIYDIKNVDGFKLLKLRNPPGDNEEWKGDWSDKSSLWTQRLKKKLGWTNEDDNCFWMCFDDFIEVYREVYVCKWFDSKRWSEVSCHGKWELGGKVVVEDVGELENENTAVGLPNAHNTECAVENNPQYVVEIDRPTEVRVRVSQEDEHGLASGVVHPFSFFICSGDGASTARVKSLTRKNVVESTGVAKAERAREIYCTLQPGKYVILVGTYVAQMDGPFKISILSNYEVELDQIWPPTWRADQEPDTFAGKMALLGAKKLTQAAGKVNELGEKAAAAAGEAGGLFGDDSDLKEEEDDEMKALREQDKIKQAEAKKKAEDKVKYGV